MDSSSSSDDDAVINALMATVDTAQTVDEHHSWKGGRRGKRREILRGTCTWWQFN